MPGIDLLPNSLLTSKRVDNSMSSAGSNWLYLYCASCGVDGGRVLEAEIPNSEEFVFYLCQPCADKYGQIANVMMVPDELFWQKIKDAQIEKYGRTLNEIETAIALDDPESMLSKLLKGR